MRTLFLYDRLPFLMAPDAEGAGGSGDNAGNGDGNNNNGTTGAGSGADNGDNGNGGTKTDNNGEDAVQAAIAKAVEDAVSGLKRKNDELLGKLKKVQDDAKKTPQISDEDYKQFQEIKARIERDELLKLMAEGKSEEAIAKATARTKADLEAALTAEREARERALQEATSAKAELENTKKTIAITSAAAPHVKPQYQDLVTRLVAEQVQVIDGQVRVVNAAGEVVERGGKPISVADLVESLRPTYADLFLATSGGGAGGSDSKSRNTGKVSMEDMAGMDQAEYERLRNAGKI